MEERGPPKGINKPTKKEILSQTRMTARNASNPNNNFRIIGKKLQFVSKSNNRQLVQ